MSRERIQQLLPPWLRSDFSLDAAKAAYQARQDEADRVRYLRCRPHERNWQPIAV